MSDNPIETPSVRAAKAVQNAICRSTPPVDILAAIIARETGCDANADIVRRLVDWFMQPSPKECVSDIARDATALRRAGGG